MIKYKKTLIFIILILFALPPASGSKFEELDKPPEGAHKGQIFLGAVVGLGIPFGDMLSNEKNFLKDEQYSFSDIGTTKELTVAHLSYDYGINFEYMPLDYIGAKTRIKNIAIVQRTLFGSNYKNWNESIFKSFVLTAGPSFHLTNRKMWDITLSPFLGYYVGKYSATPIAAILLKENGYSGNMNRNVNGLAYGADLSFVAYFSGGLYISCGIEWTVYNLKFSPGYNLIHNNKTYISGNTGSIHTGNLVFSAGYAFDN
ncbi:MAG: hypothetical protein WDA74_08370 [Spirochaetota bacterium]